MEIPTVGAEHPRADGESAPWLMPHQLAALRAMCDIETGSKDLRVDDEVTLSTDVAVLGCKAGAGKTYVVGALIDRDVDVPSETLIITNIAAHVQAKTRRRLAPVVTTVVVVPHNLARHWRAHFQRFDWVTVTVARQSDVDVAKHMMLHEPPRCLLLSATVAPSMFSFMAAQRITARRMVIDEADTVRVSAYSVGAHQLAAFYWLVTASSHNLVAGNAIGHSVTVRHAAGPERHTTYGNTANVASPFVRDIFKTVPVGPVAALLPRLFVVCDSAFVDASFEIPAPVSHAVRCRAPFPTRVLEGAVSSVVLERLHAGDLGGALESLNPGRADTETNVVAAALTQLRRLRDNLEAQRRYVEEREFTSADEAQRSRARVAANLSRVESNIATVSDRIRDSTVCPICHDDLRTKTVVSCCNNPFCLECITDWIGRSATPRLASSRAACPMCRAPITPAQLMVCCDTAVEQVTGPDTAFELGGVLFDARHKVDQNFALLLAALVAAPEDRKLLIFSDNDYVFEHMVESALVAAGMRALRLKGNADVINKRISDFKAPGKAALMINCTHYGCGMDLSVATDLLILHKIRESMYHQVVGRAQRPPRTSAVRIWNFESE